MFPSYKDIFDRRGEAYHQAMIGYPQARQEEFKQIIDLAEISDGQVICDVPSGGCYLQNYVGGSAKFVSIETSTQFTQSIYSSDHNQIVVCEDLSTIPLADQQFDCVICLAGTHHLRDRSRFYQEIYRILKPGSIFCVGDVREGSGVADFLNIFVDRHSTLGHQGIFLSPQHREELTRVGFQIMESSIKTYPWLFDNTQSMVRFCQLLFGIDRATEAEILASIEKYLGYSTICDKCYMNWELFFWKVFKHG
jgi:SAM-dependent methyltransferase